MGFRVSLLNKTMHHCFTPLYSSALCLIVGFEAQFLTVGDAFASVLKTFDNILSCLISEFIKFGDTHTDSHFLFRFQSFTYF